MYCRSFLQSHVDAWHLFTRSYRHECCLGEAIRAWIKRRCIYLFRRVTGRAIYTFHHHADGCIGSRYVVSARSKTVKNLQQGLEDVIPGLNSYNTSLANTQTQITAVDTALSSMA